MALAQMVTRYWQQEALIKDLQAKLESIQWESDAAVAEVLVLKKNIDELKKGNAKLQEDILALKATNKQAVEEFEKALNAEKKKGWKKLFYGILGGAAFGIILGAAVAQ